jgi:hypothetical protein
MKVVLALREEQKRVCLRELGTEESLNLKKGSNKIVERSEY